MKTSVRNFYKPWFVMIALAAAFLLLAGACGGDDDTPTPRPTATNVPPTATPADTPTPIVITVAGTPIVVTATPRPTVAPTATTVPIAQRTAEVVVAYDRFNDDFLSAAAHAHELVADIFDPLWEIDPEQVRQLQTIVLEPALVQKWSSSGDLSTFTVKLKQGVQAHDNYGELTAEDLAWHVNGRGLTDSKSSIAPAFAPLGITAEATGKYTVEFTSNKGIALGPRFWLRDLAINLSIFPIKAHVDAVGLDEAQRHPVGTGPFRFVSAGADVIKLEAVDDHWRVDPAMDRLTMLTVKDRSTRLALIQAGQADIARRMTASQVDTAEKSGFSAFIHPFTRNVRVMFGGNQRLGQRSDDPWNKDIRVRRAMMLAIDVETMISKLYNGQVTRLIGPYPSSIPAALGLTPFKYDPDEAKRLLADAGYSNGFDVKIANEIIGGSPRVPLEVETVASFWEAIGINTSIETQDWATWKPQRWNIGETDGYVWPHSSGTNLGAESAEWEKYGAEVKLIPTWLDATTDKCWTDISASEDDPKAQADFEKECFRYTYENITQIPLYAQSEFTIMGEGFVSWEKSGFLDSTRHDRLVFEK